MDPFVIGSTEKYPFLEYEVNPSVLIFALNWTSGLGAERQLYSFYWLVLLAVKWHTQSMWRSMFRVDV